MSNPEKLHLNGQDSILEEEDEATLAAIEEAIRQADEGELVPSDEVRTQILLLH